MKPIIVYDSRVAKLIGVYAITLFPFIFCALDAVSARETGTVEHELVHIGQVKTLGWFGFYRRYLVEYARGRLAGKSHGEAYMAITYEIEAYAHQKEWLKSSKQKPHA